MNEANNETSIAKFNYVRFAHKALCQQQEQISVLPTRFHNDITQKKQKCVFPISKLARNTQKQCI